MWQLPPIPPWNAIHPMIVHFPIVLLLLAPLFVLLGMMRGTWGRAFGAAGLMVLVLGAVSVVVVASAGDAAAEVVVKTDAIKAVLHEHEELADTTQMLSLIFACVYAVMVIARAVMKEKLKQSVWVMVSIVFLLGYGTVMLAVANTGHMGGRLVHELGVRAQVPAEALPTGVGPGTGGSDEDD